MHAQTVPGPPVSRVSRAAAAAALLCAATGVLFGIVTLTAATDLTSGMPIAPPWVPVVTGPVTGVLLIIAPGTRSVPLRGVIAVVAVIQASASLAALPHTILFGVVWLANRVTRAAGPFVLEPHWLTSGAHLVNLLALAGVVGWLVVDSRRRTGRCTGCGFAVHSAPAPLSVRRRRALVVLSAVAVLGALPYGALKTAWGLGWRGGLVGNRFDQVSLASPGFGDTAVLTLLSLTVSLAMAVPVVHPVIRTLTSLVGALGSIMLLPVGLVGAVRGLPVLLGMSRIGDPEIADWAFLLVYGSFAVWGVGLASLTVVYRLSTRRPCTG